MPATGRLSADFRWGEFPGAGSETELQGARLTELVERVLQPARWGTGFQIQPTSWLRSTGNHASGAFVDVVAGPPGSPPTRSETLRLFGWIGSRLDERAFGEVIYEQPTTGTTGHVHVSLPGHGGRGQILYENEGGELVELDPFLCGQLLAPLCAARN